MIAYKLLRVRRDGSLGSLFINRTARLPIGEWLQSENHPTPGYKNRPGWHCLPSPEAPHLTKRNRRWYIVELKGVRIEHRPKTQGGLWYLADQMLIKDMVRRTNDRNK